MDLWVVAAAAGAGYLGKHLQNLSLSDKERLLESYSKISTHKQSEPRNFLQQLRERTCPLRRLAQNRAPGEASSEQKDALDRTLEMENFGCDSYSASGSASTSEKVRIVDELNVQCLSILPPGFSGRERCPHNIESMDSSSRSSCRICKYKSLKSNSSGYFVESLSSTESYLQKVEKNLHDSHPHTPMMEPLLVPDGSQFIKQFDGSSVDSWSNEVEDACSGHSCTFVSSPFSNNIESVGLQEQAKSSQERVLGGASQSPGPPPIGMLLFLMGLAIGIMPEDVTYTAEVEKLNEQLKQAKNLVQDLQEQLDMKVKLSVKEFPNENSQPLSTKIPSSFNKELIMSCSDPETEDITSRDCKMLNNEKIDHPQLMSKIEAELEAELERLGLNMDLERTSDSVKLDQHFDVDTIQGDIKLEALTRQYDNASESDLDEGSGTTTGRTPPPNYAVSPRELSIRLHELIESRLEARIKELETALQINQNRFHPLESQCIASLGFDYGRAESLSTLENPHAPSGNALDTLDEVYGGMTKMTSRD